MHKNKFATKNLSLIGILFTTILFFSFTSTSLAQTVVSGNISTDTTWTVANSPYIISGILTIDPSAILTIKEGVFVKFKRRTRMDVRGVLQVNGTIDNRVYFTSIKDDTVAGDTNGDGNASTPAARNWQHIKVFSSATANISHAVVRYAGGGAAGGLYRSGGTLTVSNSEIVENGGIGIFSFSSGDLTVVDSVVSGGFLWGVSVSGGTALLLGNSIHGNGIAGVRGSPFAMTDARNNWWGDATGPFHATLNPSGLGNPVSDNVDFVPWLTSNPFTQAPLVLSYSTERGYKEDEESPGVYPNKGTADETPMVFKVIYTDQDNNMPDIINVVVGDGTATSTHAMSVDVDVVDPLLRDGDFTNGEQYIATSTFPKAVYAYYFEASNGTDTVSLPEITTLSFETGYSNVAFLPGLQASRLYQGGVKLWEPTLTTNNEDIQPLFLNSDGTSINTDIVTQDIIDEASGVNIYNGFDAFMDTELVGAGIINEWEALPYDWRLPFDQILASGKKTGNAISYLQATSSSFITQEIRRLAETSQNGKVTIVAHSNGGLLAKTLLQSLEDSNDSLLKKIDRLVLVAVPQIGTPKAVEGLLHGNETQIGAGLLLNEEYAREFAENMQSAYTLLPSEAYFSKVLNPVISFANSVFRVPELVDRAGTTITSASSFYSFLLGDSTRTEPDSDDEEYPNVLKLGLLANTIGAHSILDSWTPPLGLEVVQIAGWGADTLSGIEYSCGLLTCSSLSTLDREVKFVSEGDGTVVFPSAVFLDESEYFVNLRENNRGFEINRDHKNILEVDSLQTVVKEVIQGTLDNSKLPNFISAAKPTENDPRKRLILRSPVAINIFDSAGRHTGPLENSGSDLKRTEAQIPNSYYREIAGHTYLGLDGRDTYRIELRGEDFGTFTFEINDVLNDEIIKSSNFVNIPVTQNTTGELTITQSTTTALVLDIDGDGTADITISAGEEQDTSVSLKVLSSIIGSLDIHKGFKKELIGKVEKAIKELEKGKTDKAIKKLEKVVEKLEKEIKRNLKREEKEEHEDDKHKKHKDKHDKHEEEYGHDKKHDKEDEGDEGDDEEDKKKKVKISTQDAKKLIDIIEKIMFGVV